ncbi:MAG: CopD family protein [Candidatus Promineifilaceae bacterium]|nr:CopD family protein [Candidatus Promineifilaceae bacterium]
MEFSVEIPFWALALSYWVHLLSTVIWLGGLTLMALVAWPAVRTDLLEAGQWADLQRRFTPWANASLVLLWVTGFLQMTADENYDGFLVVDTLWAQAILIKHLAVLAMMAFGLYVQWRLHPALARLSLVQQKRPQVAEAERAELARREVRLLRLNLVCAAAVLFFTAVATAV